MEDCGAFIHFCSFIQMFAEVFWVPSPVLDFRGEGGSFLGGGVSTCG